MKSSLSRLIRRRPSYQQDLTITPYTVRHPEQCHDEPDTAPSATLCNTHVDKETYCHSNGVVRRSVTAPVSTAFDSSFGSDSSQSITNLAPLGTPLPHLLDLTIQQLPTRVKNIAPLNIVSRTMSRKATPVARLEAPAPQEPRTFAPGEVGLGIAAVMGDILSQLRDVEMESLSGFALALIDNSIVVDVDSESEPPTPMPATPTDLNVGPLAQGKKGFEGGEEVSSLGDLDCGDAVWPVGYKAGARTSDDQWCSLVNLDSYGEVKML